MSSSLQRTKTIRPGFAPPPPPLNEEPSSSSARTERALKRSLSNSQGSQDEDGHKIKKRTPLYSAEKMYRNGEKAIAEGFVGNAKHTEFLGRGRSLTAAQLVAFPILGVPLATEEELPLLNDILLVKDRPVETACAEGSSIGIRPSMQDAHFVLQTEEGTLSGIFDGHTNFRGLSQTSLIAQKFCEENFAKFLKKEHGDVRKTFTKLLQEANRKVLAEKAKLNQPGKTDGSTAVLCYVDHATHAVYTATVGDSEARIYRPMEDGTMRTIPLSCIRNWSSPKDAIRAAAARNEPEIAVSWPHENAKFLRVQGLNVSRALGDGHNTAISSKPKISMNMVRPGDCIVVGCDGLWDFTFDHEVSNMIRDGYRANSLVNYAIHVASGQDNTTVISMKIR